MGLLRELSGNKACVLEAEHLVGRSPGCSLVIDRRYISSEHAHLRWQDGHWVVKDLGSLNGTFLDGVRLNAGADCELQRGSRLIFGKPENTWELGDDAPPRVMVVPIGEGDPVFVEGDLLVLPSEEDPRFTIYRNAGMWVLEQPNESTTPIRNGQLFELEGRAWRFCCPEGNLPTTLATGPGEVEVRHIQLVFLVSRDEEFVEIRGHCAGKTFDLGSRTFNYLLLTLARKRVEDAKEGAGEADCGWIYQEDIEHDPSMASPQLNVNVLRIRRHFAAQGVLDSGKIIERRPRTRQLRIGTGNLSIVRL